MRRCWKREGNAFFLRLDRNMTPGLDIQRIVDTPAVNGFLSRNGTFGPFAHLRQKFVDQIGSGIRFAYGPPTRNEGCEVLDDLPECIECRIWVCHLSGSKPPTNVNGNNFRVIRKCEIAPVVGGTSRYARRCQSPY